MAFCRREEGYWELIQHNSSHPYDLYPAQLFVSGVDAVKMRIWHRPFFEEDVMANENPPLILFPPSNQRNPTLYSGIAATGRNQLGHKSG